jgi:succinate dehydrogenase / fumarate reductase, membrane anchor subunit
MTGKTLRTPLSRVIHLGSAKDGTRHWWLQRVTAIALIPLGVWFAASMVSLAGADLAMVKAWLGRPLPALFMVLFLGVGAYHLKLGLQVVIEDYVHDEAAKVALLLANAFACVLVGGAAILAALKLAFGGA